MRANVRVGGYLGFVAFFRVERLYECYLLYPTHIPVCSVICSYIVPDK